MKRAAAQMVIEFRLLQSARSTEAFLVARGDVSGGRLALRACFRAFQNDDISRHGIVSKR